MAKYKILLNASSPPSPSLPPRFFIVSISLSSFPLSLIPLLPFLLLLPLPHFQPPAAPVCAGTQGVGGRKVDMDMSASTVKIGNVLSQCAESKVYECNFYEYRAVCKHRFTKAYRHPALDQKLREQRTVREARALVRCRKHGVLAPTVFALDRERCAIVMERIDGLTVRDVFNREQGIHMHVKGAVSPLVEQILRGMGEVVGLLHNADIIHGDLTTSNFMCTMQSLKQERTTSLDDIASSGASSRDGLVVLDFGLVMDKNSAEERAVDLYVLERAIVSSHPFLEHTASSLVLEGYHRIIDAHKGAATAVRLEKVRARGRKRSMVG